ncbi:MAG: DMT family transporter [Planctomycetes bacterium]|nr:DMT family transporter [Planctomycetota bacterium]
MFRKGVLIMLVSSFFFAAMAAMVRGLPEVSSYTMATIRFLVGGLVMLAVFAVGLREMRWINWPWIVARGVSGGFAVVLFYWSIQNVGLAKGTLYSYTYSIFASLFAGPILHERIRPRHWAAIAVAMIGIALVVGVQRLTLERGDLAALACGVFSGFAVVCLTKSRRTDTSTNIFWSQCLFGLVIVAWPAATTWLWPTAGQWVFLVIIALLATAGQLTMTYAYKFTGASFGSLLSLVTPVLSSLVGILHFRERPTAGFFVGGLLILVACAYLSFNPVSQAVEETADAET